MSAKSITLSCSAARYLARIGAIFGVGELFHLRQKNFKTAWVSAPSPSVAAPWLGASLYPMNVRMLPFELSVAEMPTVNVPDTASPSAAFW